MSDYTKDLVDIKGKKYQPVASRLRMALDAAPEVVTRLKNSLLQSCTTEILYNTEKYLGVKVSVKLKEEYGGGIFEGVAESDRQSKTIEGDSPLEVAETSALGRALAKAGILIDLSEFASANEMYRVQYQERSRPNRPAANPRPLKPAESSITALGRNDSSTGFVSSSTGVSEDVATVSEAGNSVICADCSNIVEGFTDPDGKFYSPEALALSREKRFGRILCSPCARKARKTA